MTTSFLTHKKIAIVGAGPGGLTLARLLQINGADVTIYERDLHEQARPKGATLDLHEESGLLALKEAKLMDAFMANYRPGAERMRIIDKTGTVLLDDHTNIKDSIDRPEIDRGPLQKILLDSLIPDTIVWNKQFASLSQQNGSCRIEFKDGTFTVADLVIAADGANSKTRPYITPIQPFYSGVTVVEGAVYNSETASPKIHALLKGGKIFAFGNEQSLIVSSKGDGSLVFYTGCKTDENWVKDSGINFNDKAQVIAWFKKEFTGWDSVWLELFENATLPFVPRPQYCMPLDQTWEALPNITMLGDAAHLMPPYAGEGVNMAMLDALELSKQLTDNSYTSLQEAIAGYEKQMRARASDIAGITMHSTATLHSPGAIDFMLNIMS